MDGRHRKGITALSLSGKTFVVIMKKIPTLESTNIREHLLKTL